MAFVNIPETILIDYALLIMDRTWYEQFPVNKDNIVLRYANRNGRSSFKVKVNLPKFYNS